MENRLTANDFGGMPLAVSDANPGEYQPAQTFWGEDLTLSPGAQVTVKISDALDPSRVLFSFEGTLAELMVALVGGQTAFGGPYGVVIRIPLNVPAGNVLWVGRMDFIQGDYRCHADLFLFQGVPFFWGRS